MTEERPASVRLVPPREMLVEPIVIDVLVSEIVLAAEPSYVVPESSCKPVPTVSAFGLAAVIVPEAPKDTVTPL